MASLTARPLLTNLIAGVQIAITQPVRVEDAIIVEDEWGCVEEISSTYVMVRLLDWLRTIPPITFFPEKTSRTEPTSRPSEIPADDMVRHAAAHAGAHEAWTGPDRAGSGPFGRLTTG